MKECHQVSDTADCTLTHYEWNKEMKQPVSKQIFLLVVYTLKSLTYHTFNKYMGHFYSMAFFKMSWTRVVQSIFLLSQ